MDYTPLIEYLRQKQYLTDLEQDILDTANELQKTPFDRRSAEWRVEKNQEKHPDICGGIVMLSNTPDQNVWRELRYQLGFLLGKKRSDKANGK